MGHPRCPACKALLRHEDTVVNGGGFERVFCPLCGWSLDRPATKAVVVEKQVAKPEVVPAKPTQKNVSTTQKPVPAWVANALALKDLAVPTPRRTTMSDNTHHTLGDLNERLFSQLNRISNGEITGEKIKAEIERTRAISGLAKEMISNAKLVLDAEVALRGKDKPGMLAIESK